MNLRSVLICHYSTGFNGSSFSSILCNVSLTCKLRFQVSIVCSQFYFLGPDHEICLPVLKPNPVSLFANWRIKRFVYLHYKTNIPFAFAERLSLSRPTLSIRKVPFFISQYYKVKCAIFMDKVLTLSQKWKSIGKRREIDGLQWRVPFKTQLSTKQARNVRCKLTSFLIWNCVIRLFTTFELFTRHHAETVILSVD